MNTKNRWEEIAKENITNAYNWRVGEMENAVQDGDITEGEFQHWVIEDGVDEIYHAAITTAYYPDMCGGPAPKEMRFATRAWCINYIKDLFREDGYSNREIEEGIASAEMEGFNLNTAEKVLVRKVYDGEVSVEEVIAAAKAGKFKELVREVNK